MSDEAPLAEIRIRLVNDLPRTMFELNTTGLSLYQNGVLAGMLKRHAEHIQDKTRGLLESLHAEQIASFDKGVRAGRRIADMEVEHGGLRQSASTREKP